MHPASSSIFSRSSYNLLFRLVAWCACLCLCLSCGCAAQSTAPNPAPTSVSAQRFSIVYYDVFDTVTTVIGYAENEAEFSAQVTALHADLQEYHKLYDIYNDYDGLTNLKSVNETAALAPVVVDEKIFDLLTEAKELHALSNGKINVAMGSVLSLWHDARSHAEIDPERAAVPSAEELAKAAEHTDIDDIILDADAQTVFFADPLLKLDVGSCGKGYAVECAAQNAKARGLTSAIISVGGNLRGIGQKPDGSSWSGGIEDPWKTIAGVPATDYLVPVYVSDLSLVVSGDYQRYYTVDGVRYHHLIDPDTNMPATYYSSVSVLTPDSGLADCLSTALFCMPLREGQALVESLPDTEALWCLPDSETLVFSSGFDEHIKADLE